MSTRKENYFFGLLLLRKTRLRVDFFATFLFMAMICSCLVFPSSGTDKKLFYLLRVVCGETTIMSMIGMNDPDLQEIRMHVNVSFLRKRR